MSDEFHKLNIFEHAEFCIPSIVESVIHRFARLGFKPDPDDMRKINELDMILEALWIYWSDTEDADAATAMKIFQDKLMKMLWEVEQKRLKKQEMTKEGEK